MPTPNEAAGCADSVTVGKLLMFEVTLSRLLGQLVQRGLHRPKKYGSTVRDWFSVAVSMSISEYSSDAF